MTRHVVFALLLLVGWLARPAAADPLHPVPEQKGHTQKVVDRNPDPKVAVPRVLELQARAWNRGDIRAFMDGYLKSPDTTFTSGGVVTMGWDTVLARYESMYGLNPGGMGRLRFENVRVTPLGKDYALCVGQWFLEGLKGTEDGVFSLVWQRTKKDGWKIIHDHTSIRPPSMPTTPGADDR